MNTSFSRRQFLKSAVAAAGVSLAPSWLHAAAQPSAYSFIFLGDLHYDKLEHHDFAWLAKSHPNDRSQIENYSRITRDVMPALFAAVRTKVEELNQAGRAPVAFVLQAGDIVEGLCGSEERSMRQNTEALDFVRSANLGAPFLFTKGNHDVTGDGSVAAFQHVFHPFLTEQAHRVSPQTGEIRSAHYVVDRGNAQFAFFDAYQAAESLEWFEAVAAKRTAEHFFAVIHPPVVPYGARSTWHIFSADRDKAKREKILQLLGQQHALVLGGHIHKFNSLARVTDHGRFAQLAISSVITAPDAKAKYELSGVKDYSPDQVRVEPSFSPDTEAERRRIYEVERPYVKAFEYADLPGYAVVTVDGPSVTAKMYSGVTSKLWRTTDLSGIARA